MICTVAVTLLLCMLSSSKTVSRLRLEPLLLLNYSPPKINKVRTSDHWKFASLNICAFYLVYTGTHFATYKRLWSPSSYEKQGLCEAKIIVEIIPDKISRVQIKYPRKFYPGGIEHPRKFYPGGIKYPRKFYPGGIEYPRKFYPGGIEYPRKFYPGGIEYPRKFYPGGIEYPRKFYPGGIEYPRKFYPGGIE